MNRPIRFRAWDIKGETFATRNIAMDCDGMLYWILGFSVDPVDRSQFEVMQFTGLLDKNGTEIYEGDLVKATSDIVGEIVFHNGAFCWKYGATYWLMIEDGDGCIGQTKFKIDKDSEVIGNIHQNTELLK